MRRAHNRLFFKGLWLCSKVREHTDYSFILRRHLTDFSRVWLASGQSSILLKRTAEKPWYDLSSTPFPQDTFILLCS